MLINYGNTLFNSCSFINNLLTGNGSISLVGGKSTIKNCHFENNILFGVDVLGGAIFTNSCSVVEIVNTSFERNRAIIGGAAIFSSGRKLTVEKSSFTSNNAFTTHKADSFGGAILHRGDILLITTSCFRRNSANKGGAISYFSRDKTHGTTLLIKTSSFIANSAFDEGGAVNAANGNSEISNCLFKDNKVMDKFSQGGAIYYDGKEMLIKNSSFDGNVATYAGGAVISNAIKSDIWNSCFTNNEARSSGAIYFNGKEHRIELSLFRTNQAAANGGSIIIGYSSVKCEISNCTFEQNVAKGRNNGDGGAIVYHGKELLIRSSLFKNNCAFLNGGAIIIKSSNVKSCISNCDFDRNMAKEGNGGAISYSGRKLFIKTSSFNGNTAFSYGGALSISSNSNLFITDNCDMTSCSFDRNLVKNGGGAIYYSGKELVITASLFKENSASFAGGAILIGSSNENSDISNCTFSQNNANQGHSGVGGAISYSGKELSIKTSLFNGNTALFSGGAIYTSRYSEQHVTVRCDISSCSFERNLAKRRDGGAIYYSGKDLFITASLFYGNSALFVGGAIHIVSSNVNSDLSNCTFKQNNAKEGLGGGIFYSGKELVMETSSFKGNIAFSYGGALSMNDHSNISIKRKCNISNCSFERNLSKQGGGAISYSGKELNITASLFNENSAYFEGGAILIGCSNVRTKISNCTFKQNKSFQYGGGAISYSGKELFLRTSSFNGNVAFSNGGAVSISSSSNLSMTYKCDISCCVFERNLAKNEGGAIYYSGKELLITASFFNENNASFAGGAILIWCSNVKSDISNCTFKQNTAMEDSGNGGGAISYSGKELFIERSLFYGNIAFSSGGATSITDSPKLYSKIKCNIAKCNISNCSFQRNLAKKQDGGAIYYSGKELFIKGSLFDGNAAISNGGAIMIDSYTNVYTTNKCDISNCSFEKNLAKGKGGGAVYYIGKELFLKKSLFHGNTALFSGGAIYVSRYSDLYITDKCDISSCSFKRNVAKGRFGGGAIYFSGKRMLTTASIFNENSAFFAGGAIRAEDSSIKSNISNCTFKQNNVKKALGNGGAISFSGKKLFIERSTFNGNTAVLSGGAISIQHSTLSVMRQYEEDAISYSGKELLIKFSLFERNIASGKSGEGGALYMEGSESNRNFNLTNIVMNTYFEKNKAHFRGGAIMSKSFTLLIDKSKFFSSSYAHGETYAGGEFLYSMSSFVVLINVSFKDEDNFNARSELILHLGRNLNSLIADGLSVDCLPGKNLKVSDKSIHNLRYSEFDYLAVSSSFCFGNSYSLYSGHLYMGNKSVEKTSKRCINCPLGGVCEKGVIRAVDNSWGYIFKRQVYFIPCPFGYCCVGQECRRYNSCHKRRRGTLCSQCKEGLTENLITTDCLPHADCKHNWLSLLVIIVAIIYMLIFMYMNQVMTIIKVLLIPSFISQRQKVINRNCFGLCDRIFQDMKLKLKIRFARGSYLNYLTNDINVEETELIGEMTDDTELINSEEMHLEIQKDFNEGNDTTESIFPGFLKILIFFYQTNGLFKIYSGSKSHGFVHIIQEALSAIFNLRADGLFTQDLSWCPIDGLRPVTKAFLKSSFIMLLLALVTATFMLPKVGKKVKLIGEESYSINKSRLLCCCLRFVLISYAGITAACFSVLLCVQLGDIGKVLFIDGSITCYKEWQIAVIFVVCFWICPFPVAIYAASRLLHAGMVSTRTYVFCLAFPIPTVMYWLYSHAFGCKNVDAEVEDSISQDETAKEVLGILEGPFRNLSGKKRRLSWETMLIGRRLVLIFIKTFLINTFIRLCLMLVCIILFSLHHIYVKPFSSSILNNLETLSLFMLTCICILNIVPAFNYAYPSSSYVQGLVQKQQQIESVLNLVFPSLVGSCVIILLLIRIFQLVFWLKRSLIRIFNYIKQKLS